MKKYIYNIDTSAQDAPAKLLRAVGRDKRVLEVGCASGAQTRIMTEQLGCTVTGLEIDPVAAQDAAKYCDRVIVCDLERDDLSAVLGTEKFEVITIADVLEHLRQPSTTLTALREFLQPDGYIVASIPNVVHAGLILQMDHGRFDYRPYGLLDDTHLRFFTLKSVLRLFEESGLEVVDIDRAVRPVERTEFSTHPASADELAVLEFIRQNNPEWQTYQFVIQARRANETGSRSTYAELEAKEKLKDAEISNQALTQRVRRLESQVAWLESRFPYGLLGAIKKFISPRTAM